MITTKQDVIKQLNKLSIKYDNLSQKRAAKSNELEEKIKEVTAKLLADKDAKLSIFDDELSAIKSEIIKLEKALTIFNKQEAELKKVFGDNLEE